MNATLTIQIRVVGRAASQQLQQLQQQLVKLQGAQGGAAKSGKSFLGVMDALSNNKLLRVGRTFSQIGRQLTYGFTLPVAAAATSLTKANLNIGRSMTQVRKVYGDLSFSSQRIKSETDALAKSFELLSTRFGEHQEDVIDIAAAWASAGSAGRGLAENTKSTLEAMILGDMEAEKATESLIAIQAQWGLSTQKQIGHVSEFTYALGVLNIVENQTGITFAGLTEVLERSSGTWRTAGGTLEELVAVAAAMVPAAGSASQAGNAIKTMTTRLIKPTRMAAESLKAMGIEVASPEWMGATVTEKLFMMAKGFDGLTNAQKQLITATSMGAWQVNRFDILMQDLLKTDGMFARAMDATRAVDQFGEAVDKTSEQSRVNQKYQQELLTVLDSSPKKWDIMTQAIRNNLTTAFLPLIPTLMSILDLFRRLSEWFANLDPNTQQWILIGAMILALIGPLSQLVGAFISFGGIFFGIGKAIFVVMTQVVLPVVEAVVLAVLQLVWGLVSGVAMAMADMVLAISLATGAPLWAVVGAIAAVVAAIILVLKTDLEDKIWEIMKRIARGLGQLPGVFAAVFNAIIKVLGKAVEAIVDGLSYLNPFQRHSPSLVDNIRAGVAVILSEYKRLSGIPGLIRNAIKALDDFAVASAPGRKNFRHAQLGKLQEEVTKADPRAGAATGPLVDSIMALEDVLPALAREISDQELVVARWEDELKKANLTLDAAEAKLSATQDAFDALGDQIETAKSTISDLANRPITGMKALEDQIFNNEMAQARFNMQLLEFEKQGKSIDEIRDRMAALNGEIELLSGERNELRLAGAGSDILKTYDDQISAIEAQKRELGETADQINAIQHELDALDLEHRFLELTKQLDFDPLVRQVNELANGVKEMSFDDIVAGIREQQALIATLQPQYDQMAAAVQRETTAVEDARRARDLINEALDTEQGKLQQLESSYADITNLIQDMESSMSDFVSLIKATADDSSTYFEDLLAAAALADFDVAPGDFTLKPEGDLFDIEAFNAELEKTIEDMWNFDIWDTIKQKWDLVWEKLKEGFRGVSDWVKEHWAPLMGAGVGAVAGFLLAGPLGALLGAVLGWFAVVFAPKVAEFLKNHVANEIGAGVGAAIGMALLGPLGAVLGAVIGWFAVDFGPKIGAYLSDNTSNVIGAGVGAAIGMALLGPLGAVIGAAAGWFAVEFGPRVGGWIYDNVILPIGRAFEAAWNMVYSWVKTNIVTPVKNALMIAGQVPGWIYNNIILPIGRGIQGAWSTVYGWVRDYLVKPIGDAFQTVADTLMMVWNDYIMPVIDFIMAYVVGPLVMAFGALAAAIVWTWQNVIGPIVDFVWKTILEPVFNAIFWVIDGVLRPVFWLLAGIVEIVFVSIWRIVEWVWENVLSKTFDAIWWAIEHVLIPIFTSLGDILHAIWTGIWEVISFAWNWIIKPIFGVIFWTISEVLIPIFESILTTLKRVWDGAVMVVTWAWDYMIKPIFEAIDWTIRNVVGPVFDWILDEVIKPVWNAIGSAIGWVWDNVIRPIFDSIVWVISNILAPVWDWIYNVIVDVWNGILYAIGWVWDKIATVLEGGINLFIHAFNAIARTVSWIADFLSIDVNIDTIETISIARIPYDEGVSATMGHDAFMPPSMPNFGPTPVNAFARGGMVPIEGTVDGSGSIVKGARAIVGEGSKLWPEYIVPTDPRYRGRAQGLWAQVGKSIGMFADGGPTQPVGDDEYKTVFMGNLGTVQLSGNIISDTLGAVSSTGMADWAVNQVIKGAWAIAEPIARSAVDLIPLDFLKNWSTGLIDKIDHWVDMRGEVEAIAHEYQAKPDEEAGSWKKILRYLEANNIPYRAGSTYRPGAITRNTGQPSWHGLDRAVDIVDPFSSDPLNKYNPAVLERIAQGVYMGFKPHLKELIYGGTQQWNVFRGSSHNFSAPLIAEHMNHVHAAMAAGGSFGVRSRPGGQVVSMLVGEGGRDERIKVTPLGADDSGRTYNFYDTVFEFPNIRDPDDAQTFLDNLESLTAKRTN